MITGIGTDIVSIERFGKALERVAERCFTPAELAYAEKSHHKLEHLAGRWAAKEALAKALGCGFGEKCSWQDIEILNDSSGRPVMTLSGCALQTCHELGGVCWHVSISHEKDYATAFVVIEGEK